MYNFASWCTDNYLKLNAAKCKEIIFDFRKNRSSHESLYVMNAAVDIVSEHKYLGVYIDDKLNWKCNTGKVYAKCNQRLYFLRRMKSFNVHSDILYLFYQAVIQSILTFCSVAWFSGLSSENIHKLNRIVKSASRLVGVDVKHLDSLCNSAMEKKFLTIISDEEHPLHSSVTFNRSGRIRYPRVKTNRFRDSFLPSASKQYNISFCR